MHNNKDDRPTDQPTGPTRVQFFFIFKRNRKLAYAYELRQVYIRASFAPQYYTFLKILLCVLILVFHTLTLDMTVSLLCTNTLAIFCWVRRAHSLYWLRDTQSVDKKKITQTHAYLYKRMQHTKRCHSYSKQQNIVTRETIHFQWKIEENTRANESSNKKRV